MELIGVLLGRVFGRLCKIYQLDMALWQAGLFKRNIGAAIAQVLTVLYRLIHDSISQQTSKRTQDLTMIELIGRIELRSRWTENGM